MAGFLSDSEFEKFSTLIYNESGIHFSSTNRTILESRLKERLRAASLEQVSTYYQLILQNREELRILLDSVTTNLTRFFRNAAHFAALENYVIPHFIRYKAKKNSNHLRLWCAGCSTGEEPYSLAIVLKEKLPSHFSVEITGSDLSLKSLMTAQEGFYQETRIGGVPPNYLSKYFEKKHDGYQIKADIKSLVKFDYHNLKNDSGLRNVDLVFCRNVMIYFDAESQKAAVTRFWEVMNEHSFLFIGHSESLFGMETSFEFVKTEWATFYRKWRDSPGD
ncbi:MAG TPA: protein-glutamate O-methyltransferase CheR [Spirochaetales bacterium]|nr:protein-glutamate O-methyltransferase CheR [Spirochaetales bacterium]